MSDGLQLRLFGKLRIQPVRKTVLIEKELIIDGIGKIRMVKKQGVKRISISIRPESGARVTLPLQMEFSRAEKFVIEKKEWLRKNLAKAANAADKMTIFDYSSGFTTRDHRLEIRPWDECTISGKISGGVISVYHPFENDVRDPRVQAVIRQCIEKAWRKEALKYLPERVRELADRYGFRYNSISVKNARTRWGSCSSVDNLNFSLHLMRLPDRLRDYIILHELTHTVHKNHGKGFWKLLDEVSGNAAGLDREMKDYRIGIY